MASILCLDDEPAIGLILQDTLERAGHQAVSVHNVPQALQALKNPYMFRIRPADSTAAVAMAQFVKGTLKATKPGIIYIQNDFGQGAAKAATKTLADAGIAVVASEAYGGNDKDMSAQLLSLKNKGADAIIALSFPQDGALLLRQI